jgi:hypothetical protein
MKKPRPKVAATRSSSRPWISRSRKATVGTPPFSWIQLPPASRLKKTPNSVPAKSSSGFTGSSTIVQPACPSGNSPGRGVQVRPRSALFRKYGVKSPDLWLLKTA